MISSEPVPSEIMDEAKELCFRAEVLPGGVTSLAQKIQHNRKLNKPLRVKLGIDPTSTDLHVGHSVVVRKLRQFQEFGHRVVLIIGGFTAQVGDPSGRNTTRPPLTANEVAANAQTYLNQMGLILDLNKTEVVNNADWLSALTLTEILRLASLVTANQLLAKEAFGDRLEKQLPVAFHELFYPLLQGYDSVAIKSDIELGGTDQRFNILQGRELQPHYGLEPQLAMLLPLLEGTDGERKMSKSYNNYIGLTDKPDDMFGKCMRIKDELILKYFELATILSGAEIDAIRVGLERGNNPKDIKEKLATQIVSQYHGSTVAKAAFEEWRKVHSQKQLPDNMPLHIVTQPGMELFRLLVDSKLAPTNSEAKRLSRDGGVRLDGNQVFDPNFLVQIETSQERILQVGWRKFVRLVRK